MLGGVFLLLFPCEIIFVTHEENGKVVIKALSNIHSFALLFILGRDFIEILFFLLPHVQQVFCRNWLCKACVAAVIYSGQLLIEPHRNAGHIVGF